MYQSDRQDFAGIKQPGHPQNLRKTMLILGKKTGLSSPLNPSMDQAALLKSALVSNLDYEYSRFVGLISHRIGLVPGHCLL